MPELELLEYYKKMCERNIVLDFQGAMSQDMLVGMAELIKLKNVGTTKNPSLIKKVFSVFVEMAQNIAHYSTERVYLDGNPCDSGIGAGIIVVMETNKHFTVTSGNLVANETIPNILAHCEIINKMDKEELKFFYKKQIKATREKWKRGAGVGLIDMARKSGNPIQYRVTPVDYLNSFLVLSIKIQEDNYNEQPNY
jgi:hypothetical protein